MVVYKMKVTQITWAVFHVFWNYTTALCDEQTETNIIYLDKTLEVVLTTFMVSETILPKISFCGL